MKNFKKSISMILCLLLLLGNLVYADEIMPISAPVERDYESHWAQATIEKWLNEGMVSGYPDGSYKPDNKVTRAEFVKMVNGIIDYSKMSDITYKDVPVSEWYYDYIRTAQSIGYISGYSSGQFGPNDYITREQAASILARIQFLKNNEAGAGKFSDKNSLSSWAVEAVGATSEAGFISGYVDGSFQPQKSLTRAEAITMLDNVLVNAKNKVIYNDGTELKDMVIEGDLIIAKTVGDGNVYLTNVEIKGGIQIYGGGINSLYFKNVKVAKIEVLKDKVRLVFEDGSIVEDIEVGTETVIENKDGEIQRITISDKEGVVLSGNLGEVTISGTDKVTLKDAVITKLIVEDKVTIYGKGTVKTLEAKADGITYESAVKVDKVVLGEGVKTAPEAIKEDTGGGPGGDPTPAKKNIQIKIEFPDGEKKVFNEEFPENKLIYNAVIDILDKPSYTDLIEDTVEKFVSKLDSVKIGEAEGIDEIWDKLEEYLEGTSISLSDLKTAVDANEVKTADIKSALEEFKKASTGDLDKILEIDFNKAKFYLDGNEITYTITETGKGSIPETNNGIAEFLIKQIMASEKTIGEFLEEYGIVTITAVLGNTGKTAKVSIGVGNL